MNQVLVGKKNNDLAVISPVSMKALQSLTKSEQKIIKAALAPKVKELPGETVEGELATVITTVITIAGQQADDATVFIYAGELYEKLLEDFPNVSIDEIKTALRAGVYGEYGEYYGLNPKNFYNFVKQYIFSEERKEAKKVFEQKSLLIENTILITPEIKNQNSKDFVNLLFSDYLADNLLVDFIPVYIYRFLKNEGLLLLTDQEREQIKDLAEKYYTRFSVSKRTQVTDRTIKDVMASPGFQGVDKEHAIDTYSKKFAVYQFFEASKNNDKKIIF